jgi:hypothetical protein
MTDGEEMVGEEEQAQAGAGASGGGRGVGGRLGAARLGAARPEPRTLRARLITAATNFSLTAYATLTVAVTKLLHCVWVPGTPLHTRHLFIQGSTACAYTGWQAPYVIVLCVLVALPFALPWVAAWSQGTGPQCCTLSMCSRCGSGGRQQQQQQRGAGPRVPDSQLVLDVRDGVRRALVDAYSDGRAWWEAVLMVQRLVSGA